MVILSLGSNLGDREANLRRSLDLLRAEGFSPQLISGIYQTPPWGKTDQPAFFNQVLSGTFAGSPEELLAAIHRVEKLCGRVREEKWGPRIIDLDIVDFDGLSYHSPGLQLPHPHYPDRLFVLIPLAEILPDFIVGNSGKTVREWLTRFDPEEIKKIQVIE